VLEVEDDGIGIGGASARLGPSWGLRGMEERAHYLGGMLELQPRPDGGTLVKFSMPANATAEVTET
jgi:signal transduction histidine kinase